MRVENCRINNQVIVERECWSAKRILITQLTPLGPVKLMTSEDPDFKFRCDEANCTYYSQEQRKKPQSI